MTDFSPIALALPQAALREPAAASQRNPATREIDRADKPSVEQAIAAASHSTNVDFDFLVAQARVESAMNPEARARTSSATGLYQFIESTWLDTMKRHGARFGLEEVAAQIKTTPGGTAYVTNPGQRASILDLRNDPQIASFMAAGLAEDNRAHLTPILGRQPNAGELYLAHFLGAGGAGRFLSEMQADPDQSAASLFRKPAAANRAVFYEPGGAPRSLAGVMNHLGAKMARAMRDVPEMADQPVRAVPYLITAEEAFEPRTPPAITGGRAMPAFSPRISTSPTLSVPTASNRPPRSMSNLLSDSITNSGARELSSPESQQRIQRAYERLRTMGL